METGGKNGVVLLLDESAVPMDGHVVGSTGDVGTGELATGAAEDDDEDEDEDEGLGNELPIGIMAEAYAPICVTKVLNSLIAFWTAPCACVAVMLGLPWMAAIACMSDACCWLIELR